MVRDGASNAEILRAYPSAMNHLPRIDQTRQTLLEERYRSEFRKQEVTYLHGKTGVGKTRGILEKHGYENVYGYGRHGEVRPVCCKIRDGKVYLRCRIENGVLYIEVEDKGVGMENVDKAMEPMYTSKPELERSGMGFSFMEAFMDELEVESTPLVGTIVRMKKKLKCGDWVKMPEEE